jgi:hypothetical protein
MLNISNYIDRKACSDISVSLQQPTFAMKKRITDDHNGHFLNNHLKLHFYSLKSRAAF